MELFFKELITIGFIIIDNYLTENEIICGYNIKLKSNSTLNKNELN